MNNVLAIRADANSIIGTGHVMRMIALAQAWQDAGGKVVIITCCSADSLKQRLSNEGFLVKELPASYPQDKNDLQTTIRHAKESEAEWVVVDNYAMDYPYQKAIRDAGFKLLMVDDYSHQDKYSADILLNQNYGSDAITYATNPDCHQLIGCRFALLRREFRLDTVTKHNYSTGIRHILITFGGADCDNSSLIAMKALENCKLPPDIEVTVLIGAANKHRETLMEFGKQAKINFNFLENVKNIPALFSRIDMAITAGGSTCWELARYGVAMVIVSVAENQYRMSRCLGDKNVTVFAGRQEDVSSERLTELLKELLTDNGKLRKLSEKSAEIIDARGAIRVIGQMVKNEVSLRRANLDDVMKILEWRNAPEVRNNSINQDVISEANHRQWMEKVLRDQHRELLIACHGNFELGVVRFDCENDSAVISVYLNPLWIGSGIGKAIIHAGTNYIFAQRSELKKITAEILEKNIASQKAFSGSGFSRIGDGLWQLTRSGVKNV